ncbi:MAG TPA: S8 family serine peptidase [Longimicrobiales bacterium]|nr:S8 family serine peptidase [Longimicrobiales bacterium]
MRHVYRSALRGFAAALSESAVTGLRANPLVDTIAPDHILAATGTQSNPPWGLDRSDQRNLPLSTSFTYGSDGTGVRVYVLDTGIMTSHADFGTRAVLGPNFVPGSNSDCNGHGTHVAGTVGGTTYGVAKGVSLVSVRVVGTGSQPCGRDAVESNVIAGVDWVTSNAVLPAVANVSLGGYGSTLLDEAVVSSIGNGIVCVVAAGNNKGDACLYTPSRVSNAITVGASTSSDTQLSVSNYGSCVDLYAPGDAILSAWVGGTSAVNTPSGTSQAAPHVAGAAAMYLARNPSATPSQAASAIAQSATLGVLSSLGTSSTNRLLFTAFDVAISGPAIVDKWQTYTWSATVMNATPTRYEWWKTEDGGASTLVGTSSSYTESITNCNGRELELRVWESNGLFDSAVKTISVRDPAKQTCPPLSPAP